MKLGHRVTLLGAIAVGAALATDLEGQEVQTIIVTSPTMSTGEPMPRDYSPDGRNLSPPIQWSNLPQGTRQIVVICQDHGAGNPPPWVHWLIYNIPGSATGLPEGLPIDPSQPMPPELAGAVHGDNGWGLPMYRGPAPPLGNTNHYHFLVLALDTELNLPPELTRAQVLEAIEGHVIGQGDLTPFYQRQPMAAPAQLF